MISRAKMIRGRESARNDDARGSVTKRWKEKEGGEGEEGKKSLELYPDEIQPGTNEVH